MTSLGNFGTERPAVDDVFGYFGASIRVHPHLSDLVLIDLFGAVEKPEDGASAVAGLSRLVTSIVHPDDVDEFWRLSRANRQSMEDVAQLAVQLVGALADRPTLPLSDSSDGRPPTDMRSEGDSYSRARDLLPGRPDLQLAVVRNEAQAV